MSHLGEKMDDRFNQQEKEYVIPYHYLPYFDSELTPHIGRGLQWGFSYFNLLNLIAITVEELAPARVLDVGCGDARLLSAIKSFVPECLGIDLSARAIQFAKVLNPEVRLLNIPIERLENEKFDCIILMDVLEHVPDESDRSLISEICRVLSPNGSLIISVPADTIPCIPKHFRHYNPSKLESVLSPDFDISEWMFLGPSPRTCKWTERILQNRFFILDYPPLLRFFWRLYQRQRIVSSYSESKHLIIVARKRSDIR